MKSNKDLKIEDAKNIVFKFHDQCSQWLLELEFIEDEQKFLENLLSSHFLDLSSKKLYEPAKKIIQKLKDAEKSGDELLHAVQVYKNNLAKLMETAESKIEKEVMRDHIKIEKQFENYILKFKHVKRKVFGTIKEIMKAHKQKLLLEKQ